MLKPFKQNHPFDKNSFPIIIFFTTDYGDIVEPHWHEHLEFIKVTDGDLIIHVGDNEYYATKGDIFFINSCVVHSANTITSKNSSICAIVFDRFFATNLMEGFDTNLIYSMFLSYSSIQSRFRSNHPLWKELDTCIEGICSEYKEKSECYEMLIKSYIYRMLALIIRYNKNNIMKFNNKDSQQFRHEFDVLKPVFDYIDKNYPNKISIKFVSKLVNMSEYYFCRYFKKITNMTFTEYLSNVRIKASMKLLLDTNLSITEICEKAGFLDASYFSKVFKKVCGLCPNDFRKAHKSN